MKTPRLSNWSLGLSFLILAFTLSGCSEVRLAANLMKRTPWVQSSGSQGSYKVGSPYKIKGQWYHPKEDFNYQKVGIASWYGPGFHGKKTANGEIYNQRDLTAAHKTLQLPAIVRVTNLENGRSIVVRVNDRGPYAHNRIIDLSERSAELLGFKNKGTAKVKMQVLEKESRQIAAATKAGKSTTQITKNLKNYAPVGHVNISNSGIKVSSLDPNVSLNINPFKPSATTATLQNSKVSVKASPRRQNVSYTPEQKFINQLSFSRDGGLNSASNNAPTNLVKGDANNLSASPDLYVQVGSYSDYSNASKTKDVLDTMAPVEIASVNTNNSKFYRVRLGPLSSSEQADLVLKQAIHKGYTSSRVIVD